MMPTAAYSTVNPFVPQAAAPLCMVACMPAMSISPAMFQLIAFMNARREIEEQERHSRWLRRLEPSLN